MSFAAMANRGHWDISGSLSVLSTPGGMPSMFCRNGRSMMDTVVSKRAVEMKGRLAGVVKRVTAAPRWRRRRARWRTGIVCPFDMKGNITTWGEAIFLISLEAMNYNCRGIYT